MGNGGTMHVFQASREFVRVGDARLGEESVPTPAFTSGTMFIRGKGNPYCIGPKEP